MSLFSCLVLNGQFLGVYNETFHVLKRIRIGVELKTELCVDF